MSALTFDKSELGNLEYSLQREMLSTDRRGGYMSTTIVCCNTRKYHGLMVAPIDDSDRAYVLLSSLDETIVQHDQSFNLALHRFKGTYEPRGHKYITDFEYTPTPTITYRVGGVILRKELLWIHRRTQLMIRYTLVDAHSDTRLRLRPFFAFRDKHALSKANMEADGRSFPVPCGVKSRLYPSFPWLYLQTDKCDAEFIPAPDWYYDFEYQQEIARGYDGHEDLMTTGYFEMELKKGESVIFSASIDEMATPGTIDEIFAESIARRTLKVDFLSCLRHSARQFMIRRGNRTQVIAGYPWEGVDPRQELIALPGITLEQGNKEDCMDDLDTFVREMEGGMLYGPASAYHQADTPLWFFWVLQQLEKHIGAEQIWKRYGETMKTLLESYRRGIGDRVALHENGLIWASAHDVPLTWMNTVADGRAVTPREGYQVEVNALWYNAVCYAVELAKRFGERGFFYEWKELPSRIHASFLEKFWLADECYLADYVNDDQINKFIRPNMVIACGLEYKILTEEQQIDVLRTVEQHLLTPKGLRTLSPRNALYKGTYEGTPEQRDLAAMNGTVWVWPLAFYVKALFDISGEEFLSKAREILDHFDEDIQVYGIGSINEMFDADPPYTHRGAISQAVTVGAVLYICELIGHHEARAEKTAALEGAANKRTAAKAKAASASVKTAAKAKAATGTTAVKSAKAAPAAKAPASRTAAKAPALKATAKAKAATAAKSAKAAPAAKAPASRTAAKAPALKATAKAGPAKAAPARAKDAVKKTSPAAPKTKSNKK